MYERFVLMSNLKVGSWNALCEWMRRSKEWRDVVKEADLLGLGELAE